MFVTANFHFVIFLLAEHELLDLLRVANELVPRVDFCHLPNDHLEPADTGRVEFAKVVYHSDDVQSSEVSDGWTVLCLGDSFSEDVVVA